LLLKGDTLSEEGDAKPLLSGDDAKQLAELFSSVDSDPSDAEQREAAEKLGLSPVDVANWLSKRGQRQEGEGRVDNLDGCEMPASEGAPGNEAAAKLAELNAELAATLAEIKGLQPLTCIKGSNAASVSKSGTLDRSEVARGLHGSGEPLSRLSKDIFVWLGGYAGDAGDGLTITAVHNCIIAMATRTSFVPEDSRIATVDALEDETGDLCWRWILRDAKVAHSSHARAILP
jgi:hypothetical protein